mmetsp:Transcript_44677/g.127467  ORF Transcript_44677/g.127467 Transcript_44677/m.127467 type:complete len:224 (+) Transcript_44677:794-1465(+)
MSMFVTLPPRGTYSPPSTPPNRSNSAVLGSQTFEKAMRALSRSLPMVLLPMSSVVTPGTSCPSRLSSMMKACGPWGLPLTKRFATTTARSAVRPCDIQFFLEPSSGQSRRNICLPSSHSHVVFTTSPLFTPARRSVRQKQPRRPLDPMSSSCLTCASFPSARMVPAKRFTWTVNLMPKPGPTCVANSERSRCARKNLSGSSRRSVSRRGPLLMSFRRRSALLV